jgi:hypothetical protein
MSFARMGLTGFQLWLMQMDMTPGELVQTLSGALQIDHKTFAVVDRFLKEADLIPRGGRGPSARRVTPRDMATLIIAALATDKPARAVEAVSRVAAFQLISPESDLRRIGGGFGPDHTFLDVLELICDPARYPWPNTVRLRFACEDARIAALSINDRPLHYANRADMSRMLEAQATGDEAALMAAYELPSFAPRGIITERRLDGVSIRLLRAVAFSREGEK